MMTGDRASLLAALWRYLGYFTILTNLLVAVTMTRVALGHAVGVPAITGVVLTIAIVCLSDDLLLREIVPAMGPVWWTADRMLHDLVPLASVLWWLVLVPKQALAMQHPPRWLVFPVGYLVLRAGAQAGAGRLVPPASSSMPAHSAIDAPRSTRWRSASGCCSRAMSWWR